MNMNIFLEAIESTDVANTFGAILIGGMIALCLTGVLGHQCAHYFKLFSKDSISLKAMVSLVWSLDLIHTALILASLWGYFIQDFGLRDNISYIRWPIAVSVALTAISTFCIQCFFAFRVYQLSGRGFLLPVPIATVALIRMASAFGSTASMIHQHTFMAFKNNDGWLFTMGLSASAIADVLITASIFTLLRKGRNGVKRTDDILTTLIRHSVENGALTSAGTIASLICWLSMNNLIFLGAHFVISKLYSNSFLASLHARRRLRELHTGAGVQEIPLFTGTRNPSSSRSGDRQTTVMNHNNGIRSVHVINPVPPSGPSPDTERDEGDSLKEAKNISGEWDLASSPGQVRINVQVEQTVQTHVV